MPTIQGWLGNWATQRTCQGEPGMYCQVWKVSNVLIWVWIDMFEEAPGRGNSWLQGWGNMLAWILRSLQQVLGGEAGGMFSWGFPSAPLVWLCTLLYPALCSRCCLWAAPMCSLACWFRLGAEGGGGPGDIFPRFPSCQAAGTETLSYSQDTHSCSCPSSPRSGNVSDAGYRQREQEASPCLADFL